MADIRAKPDIGIYFTLPSNISGRDFDKNGRNVLLSNLDDGFVFA
jgi:hypothetical protein